jgi:hypothetical protein
LYLFKFEINPKQPIMKNLKFLLLPVLCFVFACSDDDNSSQESNAPDAITIDGETYVFKDGKSVNNHHAMSQSHTQYSFVLSDAEITPNLSGAGAATFQTNGNLMLHLRAYSTGEAFTPGTYTIGCCDDRYFTLTVFTNETTYSAEEGTVTISGSAPNYTIQFNDIVMMSNNADPFVEIPDFIYNDGFEYTDNNN